ncbi:MAG: tetratricopeptide repeat protein [bacterium]
MVGVGLLLPTLQYVAVLRAQDPEMLGTSRLQEISSELLENASFGRAVPYLEELNRRLRESEESVAVRAREPILYFLGLGRLQRAELLEADRAFTELIMGYPESLRIASARLYRGDTFYYRQSWSDAPALYAELVDRGEVAALSPELQARLWEHYADCVFIERDWDRAESVFPAFKQSMAGWPDPSIAAEKRSKASSYILQAAMAADDFAGAMAELPSIGGQSGDARYDLSLNLALMRGGDRLYESQRFGEALYFYELVLRPDQLKEYWTTKVLDLESESGAARASAGLPNVCCKSIMNSSRRRHGWPNGAAGMPRR